MVLHFLAHFKVFDAVPLHEPISYSDLARKVDLVEPRLRRILQHAFTNHYFCSPKPDFVGHTSNSALVANDPLAYAWIFHNVDEVEPWYSNKAVEAFTRWGDTTDPRETGPNLAAKPGEGKTLFDLLETDEEGEWGGVNGKGWRVKRFGDSDKFMASGGALKASDLHEGLDWGALGKATVVDVSPDGSYEFVALPSFRHIVPNGYSNATKLLPQICGSVGNVSLEIASRNPNLSFIVQDKANLESQFHNNIPAHEKSRFSFQPHDIFTPQSVKGADVYFMRATLHKFPDKHAVVIIKNIVPAMQTNKSRLVTMDVVMDGGDHPTDHAGNEDAIGTASRLSQAGMGQTGAITRLNTSIDLQMMVVLNAKERTREEWTRLFRDADERFVLEACKQPLGNSACVLQWVLKE